MNQVTTIDTNNFAAMSQAMGMAAEASRVNERVNANVCARPDKCSITQVK